jgi:hypothetical protein
MWANRIMKIVTRVYDGYGKARQAVAGLQALGIHPSDIHLTANRFICEQAAKLDQGASLGPPIADIGRMSAPGRDPVGVLVDAGVAEANAHVFCEAVRRGGTMVRVQTDDARAIEVEAIMDRPRPVDAAARGDDYRREGWTRFDAQAEPFMPGTADLERMNEPVRWQKPLG